MTRGPLVVPPQRPLIAGFHPDPSICRAGDDFYIACSSFEYLPGLPVFHSRDLVQWQQVGNGLGRTSTVDLAPATPSGGVFAPTLRHHDGEFWLITTNVADDGWQLVTRATDPAGPWSEPVRLTEVHGIDPDLAWDDEGQAYVTWAGFEPDAGLLGILQAPVDLDTGRLTGPIGQLWSGTGGSSPEGPHVVKHGEFWYLFVAEGGTEHGHAEVVARSRTITGPYEGGPGNPILTRRGLDSAVQATGHADVVERPDGSWAIVYLGIRATGVSPQFHVLGRETFASELEWQDGWPVVGAAIDGVDPAAYSADFTAPLDPGWIAPDRPADEVGVIEDGALTVSAADPMPAAEVAFVGRRQQAVAGTMRATVDASAGTGGLSLRIDPDHHYDLHHDGARVAAIAVIGGHRIPLGAIDAPATAELIITTEPGGGPWDATGPDRVRLAVEVDGTRTELAVLDGRYVSTEVAGGMTGRLIGLSATTGAVRCTALSITPEGTTA